MPQDLRNAKNVVTQLHGQLAEARERGCVTIGDLPPEVSHDIGVTLSTLIAASTESASLESAIRKQLVSALLALVPEATHRTPSTAPTSDRAARAIDGRPRWRDRDRSLKHSPRLFFDLHYPDYAEIGLMWPDLLKHDPELYRALHVHQNRHKSERIPLPTKSQAALTRLDNIRKANPDFPLDDLNRLIRVALRKTRKKTLV
jgi:hypothetical protein